MNHIIKEVKATKLAIETYPDAPQVGDILLIEEAASTYEAWKYWYNKRYVPMTEEYNWILEGEHTEDAWQGSLDYLMDDRNF